MWEFDHLADEAMSFIDVLSAYVKEFNPTGGQATLELMIQILENVRKFPETKVKMH